MTPSASPTSRTPDWRGDGILDDPRECDFDPVSLVGIDTPCGVFTEADAAVIKSI